MRKGILSLENLDPAAAAAAEEEVVEQQQLEEATVELADVEPAGDDAVEQIEMAEDGVDAAVDVVDEAQGISDTLEGVNTNLEASIEKGEGISEEAAGALEQSFEFYRHRLQAGDVAEEVKFAAEGFAKPETRVQATQRMVNGNKAIIRGIDRNMVYAEEAVGAAISNAVSVAFTNAKKMRKRAIDVSAAFDAGTPKTEPISGPFTKALNPNGKSELTAADVVAALKASANLVPASSIAQLDKLSDLLARIKGTVNESWYAANKAQIEELTKLSEEVAAAVNSIRESSMKAVGTNAVAPIAPATKADKAKIVASVNGLLNNDKLAKALEKFDKNSSSFWVWYKNSATRLLGQWAKDVRLMSKAVSNAKRAASAIVAAQKAQVQISHAAISYLEASVGKELAKEEAGVTSAENPSIDPSAQKEGTATTEGTAAGTSAAAADAAAKEEIEGKDTTAQVNAEVKKAD